MAERDVIFTGKFVADPSARPAMKEFGKDLEEAQKKIASATSATGKSIVDTEKKLADAAKKSNVEFDKLSQASVKRAEVEQRALEARLTNQKRKADAEAANIKKVIESANQQYQKAAGQIAQANQQLMDGTARVGEGVVKLGRGFAMLGIVGEKDTKKILETLIQVQAVVDLTRGAIDLYRGMSDAVKAYQAAVAAATAAETALAAARARTAAAGGAQAAGLIPGGAGGLAALGGASSLAIGGLIASIPISAGVIANIGGSRDALANSNFYRSNFAPDTIGGNALGGLDSFRSIDPISFLQSGAGGGVVKRPFKESGGGAIGGFFQGLFRGGNGLLGDQRAGLAAQQRAENAERQREIDRENLERDLAAGRDRFGVQQSIRSSRFGISRQLAFGDARSRGLTGLDAEQFATRQLQEQAINQANADRAGLATARRNNAGGSQLGNQAIDQAGKLANESLQQAIELTRQRLAIEERIRDTRKASGEAEVQSLQDAIALQEQKIRAAQDAVRSGAERLGRASSREREQFVKVSQQLLGGNGRNLSDEQLNLAERFGGEQLRNIVSQIFQARGQGAVDRSGAYQGERQTERQARLEQRQAQQRQEESQARSEEDLAASDRTINEQKGVLDTLSQQQGKLQQEVIERTVEVTFKDDGSLQRGIAELASLLDKRDQQIETRIRDELAEQLARRDAQQRAQNAPFN